MQTNPKSSLKPSASKLGVPIFHRRRRDWTDDQKLIEEIIQSIKTNPTLYDTQSKHCKIFIEQAQEIVSSGYQDNADVMLFATWIRESLVKLSNKHGNYDLRVHAIDLPLDLKGLLANRENKLTRNGLNRTSLSLSTLFPDPKLRGFALERIQVLHRGDIIEYLNSLVSRERDSLLGYSATIMDLIHICEHKLKLRGIEILTNFATDECDIWVPSLKLGIEIRNSWNEDSQTELINILKTTNSRLYANFLALVCPDDLSDLAFHALREIERNELIDNLSIIRAGDFGKYLDKIIESQLPALTKY